MLNGGYGPASGLIGQTEKIGTGYGERLSARPCVSTEGIGLCHLTVTFDFRLPAPMRISSPLHGFP